MSQSLHTLLLFLVHPFLLFSIHFYFIGFFNAKIWNSEKYWEKMFAILKPKIISHKINRTKKNTYMYKNYLLFFLLKNVGYNPIFVEISFK